MARPTATAAPPTIATPPMAAPVNGRTPSEVPSVLAVFVSGFVVDVVEEPSVVDGTVLPPTDTSGLVDSDVGGVWTLPTTLPANRIVRMFGVASAPPASTTAPAPATKPTRAKSRLLNLSSPT